MSIEDVIRVVEKRKQVLSSIKVDTKDYKYIEDYVKNNRVRTIYDFLEIDIWTCIKCLYYIGINEDKPIEKCCSIIDSFSPLIESLDKDLLKLFLLFCGEVCNSKNIDEVVGFFREDNLLKEKSLLRSISGLDRNYYDILEKVKEKCRDNNIDLTIFFNNLIDDQYLLDNNNNLLLELCAFYGVRRFIKSDIDSIEKEISSLDFSVRKKERVRAINEYLKEKYKINKILHFINSMGIFLQAKKKEIKVKIDEPKKEIRELDFAMLLLKKSVEKGEITNTRDIIRHVKDEKVKWYILKFILEHNEKYYNELKEEVVLLEENQEANYRALLHDYHLDEVSYNIRDIMNNSISVVRDIISSLNDNSFSCETMVYALENSSLEVIKIIGNLIEKGYLSKNYVENNKEIFNKDRELLDVFLNNLDILNTYGINPYLFSESLEVLFGDNKIFNNNMKVCSNYYLLPYFKLMDNFIFLLNDNLENNINRFIEMGYKDYLIDNIGLLNNSNIQRLEVLRALNIELLDEDIRNVLDLNKEFIIPSEMVDSYIPNVLGFVDEVDLNNISLDEYQVSNMEYDISGVIVAKPKVDKLLKEGRSLYEALFSGMKLSYEEYQRVIGCLLKSNQL